MSDQITREMTIDDIFSTFPEKSQKLAQELTNSGLHCVGCSASTWETLEAGMLGHGFSDEDIDSLIGNLNAILEEEIDLSTITMTKRAADKFLKILKEEGKEGYALRFGDKPGGCSGYEYLLDYSELPSDEDEIFESNGISIHVDRSMLSRLMGCEIDYLDGLNGSGFKVSNPNAKGSCSCGSSQAY
ncbi:MAG: iron-sulfur cluster assembly accessory protein [Simkaniaceae bacterium]|nr:iron-sulfur cluster assembly accessory protein [Simkaniaceae bacterium]